MTSRPTRSATRWAATAANFDVPAAWTGRRIFLTFDGVDSAFYLWVNGRQVGYSVNSRNAAEFDITDFVKPGRNTMAVEV